MTQGHFPRLIIVIAVLSAVCGIVRLGVSVTCVQCHRLAACYDMCDNDPSFGSWSVCGSYDDPSNHRCRQTSKRQMYCPNCVGDPVTTGWDYDDNWLNYHTCEYGEGCQYGA